jgi:hypothetical protein
MSQRGPRDGRIRALYAAASAALETASVLTWAVWILCVFFLVLLVVSIVTGN